MNPWIIGTLVLSVISPVSYTKSMLKGETKPHRVTRLVIWLASISGFLGVMSSSNISGKIFAAIFLARATYLFLMSLKYGVGGSSKLDIVCLILGILALIAFVVTGSGLLAISLGVLSDLIAYIPAFVKTYKDPKSEEPFFYILEGIAATFGVVAIGQLRADIIFPIWFALSCIIMLALIYRKRLFSGSKAPHVAV